MANLGRPRIDLDKMRGALFVSYEIQPLQTVEPEMPRDAARRVIHPAAVRALEQRGWTGCTLPSHNVDMDRCKNFSITAGNGAGSRVTFDELLQMNCRRTRSIRCMQKMSVFAEYCPCYAAQPRRRSGQLAEGQNSLAWRAHNDDIAAAPAAIRLQHCRQTNRL